MKPAFEAALNDIMKEDADFYGVLLVNEHGNAADKYIADLKSRVLAVKTKRLLAGADLTEEQLKAISSLPSNKLLSAMYNANIKAPNGMGSDRFLIRDTHGVTTFAGTQAWIQKMPKSTLGQKLGNLEWRIRVEAVVG